MYKKSYLAVEVRFGGRVFLRAVYVPGLGVLLLVFHGALVRFPALHLVLLVELKHYGPEDPPGKKKGHECGTSKHARHAQDGADRLRGTGIEHKKLHWAVRHRSIAGL